jgi:hypothetical protein
MHMLYREAGTIDGYKTVNVFLISSSDGVVWSTPVEIYTSGAALDSSNGTMLSMTLMKYNDEWVSYYVINSTNMPEGTVYSFGMRTAPAVTGPWSAETRVPIPFTTGEPPWHMSIRLEPNGVFRFVLFNRDSASGPSSIWVGDASGPGLTPINMVEVLQGSVNAWDNTVYRACIIPLDTGNGDYGLYYGAYNGTTWGIGYTTFSHPLPVFAGETLNSSAVIEGTNQLATFEGRVRAFSNAGGLSEWSLWSELIASTARTASEAASAADTWAAICAATTSTSSAAVASDSLSVIANISTSIIAAAQASDQSGDSAAATASLESSVTGSDSVDALASAAASLSAGAAAGESWTVQAQVVANLLESAASSDQIARATENALNAAMLESSTASDQFTTSISLLAGTQDTASATDAFIAVVVTLAGFSSAAVASDSFGINFGQIKNIESGAISGDAWTLLASLTASLSDVCSAQDVMSARADVTASITSGAIATDTFSIVNQAIRYLVMGAITLRSALNYSVNIKP